MNPRHLTLPATTPHTAGITNANQMQESKQNRTLFCGNLDGRVTEELLYEIFLQAGPIEKVLIPKDQNRRQCSYGFVTYVHQCTVPYAIELFEGLKLFRRSINIKKKSKYNSEERQRSMQNDTPIFSNSERRCGSVENERASSLGSISRVKNATAAYVNLLKQEIPAMTLDSANDNSSLGERTSMRDRCRRRSQQRSNKLNYQRDDSNDYHRLNDGQYNDGNRRCPKQFNNKNNNYKNNKNNKNKNKNRE